MNQIFNPELRLLSIQIWPEFEIGIIMRLNGHFNGKLVSIQITQNHVVEYDRTCGKLIYIDRDTKKTGVLFLCGEQLPNYRSYIDCFMMAVFRNADKWWIKILGKEMHEMLEIDLRTMKNLSYIPEFENSNLRFANKLLWVHPCISIKTYRPIMARKIREIDDLLSAY